MIPEIIIFLPFQVFHVCWPDRKESFLCPLGTIFNQALQVCDYWYNSNCSLAPYYYTANAELEPRSSKDKNESVSSMIEALLEKTDSSSAPKVSSTGGQPAASSVISFVSQFMPIKAKIVVYPETADRRSKIVTSASIGGNKGHIKSRSRQKNRGSPKHSRVRRSAHEYQDAHEHQDLIDYAKIVLFPFEKMNESYSEVLQFRIAEALDVALMDIKRNTTYSIIAGHVEKVVDFIKKYFLKPDLPEYLDLEPGSDLYEYDLGLQEKFEQDQVRTNVIVWFIAGLWYKWDNIGNIYSKKEVAPELEEYEDFEPAPLTSLNPRFIVEPATEETFGLQKDDSSKHLKSRVERAATVLHPLKLKHKSRVNIYPGTKKALLKNYVKLFKTKRG